MPALIAAAAWSEDSEGECGEVDALNEELSIEDAIEGRA